MPIIKQVAAPGGSDDKLLIFYKSTNIPMTTHQFIGLLESRTLTSHMERCLSAKKFMLDSPLISKGTMTAPWTLRITPTVFHAKTADYSAFAQYIAVSISADDLFVKFRSKSGNILLIPHPQNGEYKDKNWRRYVHMGTFLKYAPSSKLAAFWREIHAICMDLIGANVGFRLQTIGHDVPYFHFRFVMMKPIK
jgi:hypothetical protein